MMKHIEKPTNGMYVYCKVALIKAPSLEVLRLIKGSLKEFRFVK